jgi:chemotaxis protein MotB
MKHSAEKIQYPINTINQVSFKKMSNRLNVPKKQLPSETGNEIWFLTLSDLLMLLMICFVLLFGITLQQQNKNMAPQFAPVKNVMPVTVPNGIPLIPAVASNPADTTASLESDLLDILEDKQGLQGITVKHNSQFIVLTFPEQIIFDSGQAELKSSVSPVLEKVAAFILNHSNLMVEIQGHTDDRPIHNQRYPSNWELSADLATQVAKALIQLGINPEKLSTKGFGEYHPLYSNESDSSRLKNRRVELQFSLI